MVFVTDIEFLIWLVTDPCHASDGRAHPDHRARRVPGSICGRKPEHALIRVGVPVPAEGDGVTHLEAFDPARRDLALARFD